MKVACFSETLVTTYNITVNYKPVAEIMRYRIKYTTLKIYCGVVISQTQFVTELLTLQVTLRVLNTAAPRYAADSQAIS
jgi:hypothetical protein